jgi:hypothetical protein
MYLLVPSINCLCPLSVAHGRRRNINSSEMYFRRAICIGQALYPLSVAYQIHRNINSSEMYLRRAICIGPHCILYQLLIRYIGI